MSDLDGTYADVFQRLQMLLVSADDASVFLHDLTRVATHIVDGDLSASITRRATHQLETVASSDDRARQLDKAQYLTRSGPCLTALNTARIIALDDTDIEIAAAADRRWPHYRETGRRVGLASTLSLPLIWRQVTLGALNVYSFDNDHRLDPTARKRLEAFADHAATTVYLADRQAADDSIRQQLHQALDSRTVIDQAIGILIGRHQISAADAFELMTRQSQQTHRKLREVAATLVAAATGGPPRPGNPFHTDSN